MTAEQLRNSILQEAISGRLVPQDSNDEPASVLLQHIHEEKARLVKEGKLKKKDLIETPIAEDEIPFEIPKGWVWGRLKFFCSKFSTGPFGTMVHKEDYVENHGYNLINPTNIKQRKIIANGIKKVSETKYNELNSYVLASNDLVLARRGDLSKIAIVSKNEEGWLAGTGAFFMHFYEGIDLPFFIYLYTSPFCQNYLLQQSVGGTMDNLNQKLLADFIFPLPPLAEQKRIVAKLEELLPIVDQYGKAQSELNLLNAALPARLRNSILQEAISGRLVPQVENETADGLKEQLLQAVNNSPLKKKWNSEPIEEDEPPFDIPENWNWIRLGDIVYTQTGLSYSKADLEKKVLNPIRVLRGGNIQNGAWCTKDDDVMIAPEFVKKDIFLKKNSFITPAVTSLEHLGKTALIREDHNDIVAGGFVLYLMPYDVKNDALMAYLAYFFQSAFYNSFCKTITNKSGQAFWNISREKLLKLAIPLPPLAEQQRIVAKIEELFAQIDKISK